MTRFTASRFGALIAALMITLSACSEHNPVATQFPPTAAATGFVTFLNDPLILDVLLSECARTETVVSATTIATWQRSELLNSIELPTGCYDIRVIRVTALGVVSQEHQRVVIRSGEVHFLAA